MNYTLSSRQFNIICRVCLAQRDDLIPVHTAQISYMLSVCASAQECIIEKLPQQICNHCFWKLKIAYEFRQQCVLALEILSSTLSREQGVSSSSQHHIEIVEENKALPEINLIKLEPDVLIKTEENSDMFSEQFGRNNDSSFNDEETKTDNTDEHDLKLVKLEPDVLIKTEEDSSNEFSEQFGANSDYSYNDEESRAESTAGTYTENGNLEVRNTDQLNNSYMFDNNRQKSLADLLREKYNIYDLTCNVCHKELATRATLIRHMEIHDKGRILNYCCPVCSKWFHTAETLKKHQTRHTEQAKYQCSECPKQFFVLNALVVHNRSVHKANPIPCSKCSAQFYHPLQLEQHELTHEKKEYPCDVCGKVFTLKYYLKEHQITHSEDRKFKCNQCGKEFKHKPTLQSHIKMQHLDPERREVCNVCGKSVLPSTFRSHLRSHDKGTVYPCPECGKVYNNKYVMRNHIKEKHGGANIVKGAYQQPHNLTPLDTGVTPVVPNSTTNNMAQSIDRSYDIGNNLTASEFGSGPTQMHSNNDSNNMTESYNLDQSNVIS